MTVPFGRDRSCSCPSLLWLHLTVYKIKKKVKKNLIPELINVYLKLKKTRLNCRLSTRTLKRKQGGLTLLTKGACRVHTNLMS